MKTKIFAFAMIVLLVAACKKDKKIECPPHVLANIAIAPSVYFKIIDRATSKDLFFSADPAYDTSQLKYSVKTYDNAGNKVLSPVQLSIDSTRMCFRTSMTDSAFIQIAGLTSDTLVFLSVKAIPDGPCNYISFADSVTFDKQLYVADDKQIITLKK